MKSVLLVLCQTIGDVILLNSLTKEIKHKYPDSEITVCVNEVYKNIIEYNPDIKEILTAPQWLSQWKDIVGMFKNYDEVMIPQQTTGEDNNWHQLEEHRHQHLYDFYLKRCRLEETQERKLYMHPNALDEFSENIKEFKDNILIHSQSGGDIKDWDKFYELVQTLNRTDIIQVGGEDDKRINGTRDMRGKLTFNETYCLCKKSKLFIGLDSGIEHIATASDIPTIILQGASIPETSGAFGKNVVHIVSKSPCELRCHGISGKCIKGTKCINNITVEEVLTQVNQHLGS